ncbi:MAG: FecR domain-containing protein [Oscillospiraceae bacterium]|nr:FecR domain-containing protein [Oscillospiraceae bacterium]
MKNSFSTLKGKIIAGAVTLAIIAAAVVIVISLNKGYRTVRVDELTGVTTVTARDAVSEAFKGQNLKSGDAVAVGENADLTLALDSDKHVYAKELTRFRLEAAGAAGKDARTVIKLEEGSVLSRIDNKLQDNESYVVETPNALMAVRGTTFTVTVFYDENGVCHTVVEVEEGAVEITEKDENGNLIDAVRMIGAGESTEVTNAEAIVENEPETSEPEPGFDMPLAGKPVESWDFPVPAYGATIDEVVEIYGRQYLKPFTEGSEDTYYGLLPISNGFVDTIVLFNENGTFYEVDYWFYNSWDDYNQLVGLITEELGEPILDTGSDYNAPDLVYHKTWQIPYEGYFAYIRAEYYTENEGDHPILVQIAYLKP